jgi:hypothetical protein
MWSLLKESIFEIALHWRDVFKTFWLTMVFIPVIWIFIALLQSLRPSIAEQSSGSSSSYFLIICLIIFFGVVLAPAAVKWHRTLIANEDATVKPVLPDRKSWIYLLLLSMFLVAFVIVNIFAKSAWGDLIIPIIGMFEYNAIKGSFAKSVLAYIIEPYKHGLAAPYVEIAVGKVIGITIYVLIFARWFLSLPEKSLDIKLQGATKNWEHFAYRNFLGAMIFVQTIPFVLEAIQEYLSENLNNLWGLDTTWLSILIITINLFIALLGLTLLSVAYRRNLKNMQVQP